MTTNWAWEKIHPFFDTQYNGATLYGRDDWQLIRHRFSNAAYSSELGNTALSLSAKNGGVEKIVTTEEAIILLNFVTDFFAPLTCTGSGADYGAANDTYTMAAVSSSLKYAADNSTYSIRDGGTDWDDSAGKYNGAVSGAIFPWSGAWEASGSTYTVPPSFSPGSTYPATNGVAWVSLGMHGDYNYYIESGNTATDVFVCWFSVANAKWCCCKIKYLDAIANTFDDDYASHNLRLVATTTATEIDGVVFDGAGYLEPIGTMTATTTTAESLLRCVCDAPEYLSDGTDYYKQVQTWEKKTAFVAIS